jgi:hypothetical protein
LNRETRSYEKVQETREEVWVVEGGKRKEEGRS